MKISKTSLSYHLLGFCLFMLGIIIYHVGNLFPDQTVVIFGLLGLILMWIMGIERDLYATDEKK